jgi:hypothetical protein
VLEGDAANTSFIAFGLIHDLSASEASMLVIYATKVIHQYVHTSSQLQKKEQNFCLIFTTTICSDTLYSGFSNIDHKLIQL